MTPSTDLLTALILTLLVGTAVAVVRMRGLFPALMLMGIFSLLGASWMLVLDAPDVAFTEAAVGAGVSTILGLTALALTARRAKTSSRKPWPALVIVTITGAALVYGMSDAPGVGDPAAPASKYPVPSYVERTDHDIHIPNVVTAVLASYRGFDTLGETVVIFTAGIAVLALIGGVAVSVRNTGPAGGRAGDGQGGDQPDELARGVEPAA
ncbi:MAG: DUF4040 domain-containing protein [Gemmatimonadetes bacterium]|nr:DUF4040 domain-containing protein [Gemmatimonadota bacterium]